MAARHVGKALTGSDQSQKQGHIKTKHYFSNFSRTRGGLVFILKHKQPLTYICVKQTKAFYTHTNIQMHLGHVFLLKEGAAAAEHRGS